MDFTMAKGSKLLIFDSFPVFCDVLILLSVAKVAAPQLAHVGAS